MLSLRHISDYIYLFYVRKPLLIRCKLTGTCKPYGSYVKVNPNTVLVIDGSCYDGCTQLLNFQYNYNVYQSWSLNPTDNQIIWFYYDNNTEILGKNLYYIKSISRVFFSNRFHFR